MNTKQLALLATGAVAFGLTLIGGGYVVTYIVNAVEGANPQTLFLTSLGLLGGGAFTAYGIAKIKLGR